MSTHNIGFYEDLTKIIFELSSDIIEYAPYFFCWSLNENLVGDFQNSVIVAILVTFTENDISLNKKYAS